MTIKPVHLRCEYLHNPLGIDVLQPRLSWVLESEQRDQIQSAYQILVADSPEELAAGIGNLWDSGHVDSDQSIHVVYAGQSLQSGMRCWWKVRVWDQDGQPSDYSQPAWWQMGLLSPSEWQGQWIGFDTGLGDEMSMKPSPYLRRVFTVDKPIRRAMLYATAKGLYKLRLNGQPVGDAIFAPDWTDYNQRILYNTYEVTELLQTGDNAIGAILGDAWYCGYVGWEGDRNLYGPYPQFLAQLEIEHLDGSTTMLVTDETWRGSAGPIIFSDMLMGETYDARREMPGWDQPDFDDSDWQAVLVETDQQVQLTAQNAEPVRVIEEIKPKAVTQPAAGTYVFDLGQNMVGWVRLQVQGEPGTQVQLRFAELLDRDGIVCDNLRTAKATDTYILKGDGPEVWEPHFTFHGFRYVEVTGYPGEPSLDAVTGCIVHSDLLQTGTFECSNPMVNKLWRNILWSQRGNFLSVPTDCPQRDERLGWLGDAQVFARTACLNMDAAAFFTRWMINVEDAQSPAGGFPDVAPRPKVGWLQINDGAPAWGDAGVIIPWTIYQLYGDTQIIECHYRAMTRWMAYIHEANPNLLRTERLYSNYGDWLSYNADTPRDVLATAYWAYDALLMSQMAQAIGRADDARKYQDLFQDIKAAFISAYVSSDGHIKGDTQTCYVLALYMDLLPADLRAAAARYLVEDIKRRDWHLSTGFLGAAYLLPVLTETGYLDVAYRLLNSDTCPSWGHMIKLGATTMWERWDGLTEEHGLFDPDRPSFIHPQMGPIAGMNSFNHYAFGAVGEWLYRFVAGIDTDPQQPGYQHIVIRPRPGGGLTYAKAEYQSIRGRIVSHWRIQENAFHLKVTIPANTTATVYVPTIDPDTATEGGKPAERAEGVQFLREEDGLAVFAVGSGDYHFVTAI